MRKRFLPYRLFFIALFLTLLAWATLGAFAAVDRAAESGGFGSVLSNFSAARPDPLTFQARVGKYEITMDFTWLNRLEELRRGAASFSTPRLVRLAEHWLAAGRSLFSEKESSRREQDSYLNAGLV